MHCTIDFYIDGTNRLLRKESNVLMLKRSKGLTVLYIYCGEHAQLGCSKTNGVDKNFIENVKTLWLHNGGQNPHSNYQMVDIQI